MKKDKSESISKIELLTQIRTAINEMGLQDGGKMKRELERRMLYLKVRDILSEQLHSTLNVESIYENMRKLAVNLLGIEIFQIFFYDGDEQFHYLGIAGGVPDDTIKMVLSQNRDELIADVIESSTPPPTPFSFRKPRLPHPKAAVEVTSPSPPDLPVAQIPMIVGDKVKGVMTIEKLMAQKETIAMEDAELLKLLVKETALALKNGYVYRRLENVAMTDGLTGLYNHRYFQEKLEEEVKRSIHKANPLSLLMADVNGFKRVNDAYGHRQGDAALKDLANILQNNVRSVDVPARYGGDEFVIILSETDAKRADIVAERLKKAVASYRFHQGDESIKLTISIGIASLPPIMTTEELIDAADRALYRDKQKVKREV